MKLRLLVVIIIQIQEGVLKQKSQEDSPLYVKALVKEKYGQTDALNEMENTLKLKVVNKNGHTLLTAADDTCVSLVYTGEYQEGDSIVLDCDQPCYCMVQFEDSLPAALIYVAERELWYHIPYGRDRIVFSPKCFTGSRHLIRARLAEPEEIAARRNLVTGHLTCQHHPRKSRFLQRFHTLRCVARQLGGGVKRHQRRGGVQQARQSAILHDECIHAASAGVLCNTQCLGQFAIPHQCIEGHVHLDTAGMTKRHRLAQRAGRIVVRFDGKIAGVTAGIEHTHPQIYRVRTRADGGHQRLVRACRCQQFGLTHGAIAPLQRANARFLPDIRESDRADDRRIALPFALYRAR